jgi:hypothetical protein
LTVDLPDLKVYWRRHDLILGLEDMCQDGDGDAVEITVIMEDVVRAGANYWGTLLGGLHVYLF